MSWLDFSRDGKWLAIAHERPPEIHIWNVAKNKLYKTIKHPRSYAATVRFTPDGKHLMSSSKEKFVRGRVWNFKRGKQIRKISGNKIPNVLSILSPDGKFYGVKLKTTGDLGNPTTLEVFGQ